MIKPAALLKSIEIFQTRPAFAVITAGKFLPVYPERRAVA
jgi:hypothetical protein